VGFPLLVPPRFHQRAAQGWGEGITKSHGSLKGMRDFDRTGRRGGLGIMEWVKESNGLLSKKKGRGQSRGSRAIKTEIEEKAKVNDQDLLRKKGGLPFVEVKRGEYEKITQHTKKQF